MTASDRPILLILDLDETLIHSPEQPLDQPPDFYVGPHLVYRRPFVHEFLISCQQAFQVAVWSSAGAGYVAGIVQAIFPTGLEPVFVWSRERCTQRYDPERLEPCFVKDLKKVKRLGFDLNRVLIVDDSPEKGARNYGNAVYVRPWSGEASDTELRRLATYLRSLAKTPNVRAIEKRGWRSAKQSAD